MQGAGNGFAIDGPDALGSRSPSPAFLAHFPGDGRGNKPSVFSGRNWATWMRRSESCGRDLLLMGGGRIGMWIRSTRTCNRTNPSIISTAFELGEAIPLSMLNSALGLAPAGQRDGYLPTVAPAGGYPACAAAGGRRAVPDAGVGQHWRRRVRAHGPQRSGAIWLCEAVRVVPAPRCET